MCIISYLDVLVRTCYIRLKQRKEVVRFRSVCRLPSNVYIQRPKGSVNKYSFYLGKEHMLPSPIFLLTREWTIDTLGKKGTPHKSKYLSINNSHRINLLPTLYRKKSILHTLNIIKVWFSIFNYKNCIKRSSNYQKWTNLALWVVSQVVFHFVKIKNIQVQTKKL